MTSTIYNSNGIRQEMQDVRRTAGVRGTMQVMGNVHAIVGGVLLGIGMIIFAISFMVPDAAVFALRITGASLALGGVIELIISAICRRIARKESAKLERLKAEGVGFAGEIVNVKRHWGVQLGCSFSAIADVSYVNSDGNTCLVRSSSFMYANEGLRGMVYVNPYDPSDYAVEICNQPMAMHGVYDFR